MRNLASREYDADYDKLVKEELTEARVPIIRLMGKIDNEVKTHYMGMLNNFIFERAWSYWVVRGYMPLDKAEELYKLNKDLLIRAGGHCGNEEPSTQCSSKSSDYLAKKWWKAYKDGSVTLDEANKNYEKEDKTLPQFVKMYHIDTQQGLNALADFIKENDITTEIYND